MPNSAQDDKQKTKLTNYPCDLSLVTAASSRDNQVIVGSLSPPMRGNFILAAFFALTLLPASAKSRPCIAPEETQQYVGKDVCVAAHVYRVVDGGEGVRFLDVCSPDTSDADCRFFILSLSRDEKSVGDLNALTGQSIQIRGTIHTIQGHAEITLNTRNQLHGGKEKFQPNPRLVKSFSAENGGQAFSARNGTMGQHGVHFHHRGK